MEETLLPPTRIGTRAGFDYPFSFRLTLQQQREVMESRQQAGAGAGGRANHLLVAVRCFPLDLFEGQKGRVQDLTKPPFYAPHSWPLESTLRVNREYAHVKQRQVYYHGAQRKWKGGSEPADVFMHSRVGTNLLTVQHRDEGKTYVLAVQLVRVVSNMLPRWTLTYGKCFRDCQLAEDQRLPCCALQCVAAKAHEAAPERPGQHRYAAWIPGAS